ncbi:MAG: hypothetical protein K2J67_12455, partial [Lachnospiraceae bacterium]|nr:hypothetical protein [Lachnospiraceae bacterium]
YMAAAACLGFVICLVIRNFPLQVFDRTISPSQQQDNTELLPQETPGDPGSLPLLDVAETGNEGMGFEEYIVHDIAELVNGNPWREEDDLSALPVYQNQFLENEPSSGANEDQMRECLLDIAGRLNLETNSLNINKNSIIAYDEDADYFSLSAQSKGLELEVDQSLTVDIGFDPAVSLPDSYHFSYSSSYGELEKTADYLKEQYSDLIHMKRPQVDISGGGYDMYQWQSYELAFYEAGEYMEENIVNYHFNRIVFYCDEEGKLFLARIFKPDLSQKIGSYPVITAEEATELLCKGNYITSVPDAFPGKSHVAKRELVYRTGAEEKYFMPYYRFYVELPGTEEDGFKHYGAYYVPAVEQSYLADMPSAQMGHGTEEPGMEK